jgi:hypothetical protein
MLAPEIFVSVVLAPEFYLGYAGSCCFVSAKLAS